MKEQLITFETAKLATSKGFRIHQGALKMYRNDNQRLFSNIGPAYDIESSCSYAPTQSLLQKWLREKHFIHMYVYPNFESEGVSYQINIYTDPYSDFRNINHTYKGEYKTHEKALEKGLYESLKLINNA